MKVLVNVILYNWYLLGVKKFQVMPSKQDLGSP